MDFSSFEISVSRFLLLIKLNATNVTIITALTYVAIFHPLEAGEVTLSPFLTELTGFVFFTPEGVIS
jgi:hypothetical protein